MIVIFYSLGCHLRLRQYKPFFFLSLLAGCVRPGNRLYCRGTSVPHLRLWFCSEKPFASTGQYKGIQINEMGSMNISLRTCYVHSSQSKRLQSVCEWRYPLDHSNTIISTHWHHSATQHPSTLPHTPPPASCSTVIVFMGHPIVCVRDTVDNVSNLFPNHDPTLLLWAIFPPTWPDKMVFPWDEPGIWWWWWGCSAWHSGRESEEAGDYWSVTPLWWLWWWWLCWLDMWTSYVHRNHDTSHLARTPSSCTAASTLPLFFQLEVRMLHLHWGQLDPWKSSKLTIVMAFSIVYNSGMIMVVWWDADGQATSLI